MCPHSRDPWQIASSLSLNQRFNIFWRHQLPPIGDQDVVLGAFNVFSPVCFPRFLPSPNLPSLHKLSLVASSSLDPNSWNLPSRSGLLIHVSALDPYGDDDYMFSLCAFLSWFMIHFLVLVSSSLFLTMYEHILLEWVLLGRRRMCREI